MRRLKEQKLIDRAIVSFSISLKGMKDTSFAIFGGIESKQIAGGKERIQNFKVVNNKLDTWALNGTGILYGSKDVGGPSFPAIVDTGSSQIALPPAIFDNWVEAIKKEVPNINC